MGTWGIGPFDNDAAADFADVLDQTDPAGREALVRDVLQRTADPHGRLDEAQEAIAAAALVAAQCPHGQAPSGDGPEQPMPTFGEDLHTLAAEALDRIINDQAMANSWVDAAEGARWTADLRRLQTILAPA